MRIERELLRAKNGNLKRGLVLHTCQYVSITTAEAKNT